MSKPIEAISEGKIQSFEIIKIDKSVLRFVKGKKEQVYKLSLSRMEEVILSISYTDGTDNERLYRY